jgi:hypothetical protein
MATINDRILGKSDKVIENKYRLLGAFALVNHIFNA